MRKAIILAAGRNDRIQPPIKVPKSLIKMGDKTLLEHILSSLKTYGVTEAVIVVGHLKDKITQHLGNEYDGVKIKYVENNLYAQTDNLYSLWLTKSELNSDIIYMDADIIYDKRILKALIESDYENVVLVGKMHTDSGEEMKVFGREGIAKKIGRGREIKKEFKEASLIGEAIGIVKISSKHIPALIDCMESLVKNKEFMSHENLTDFMCEKNLMNYVYVGDIPWTEIDFREDIIRAEKEVYPQIKKLETKGVSK